MELISNKIIIVFETNNLITSDEIKSSVVIKRKYSDIYTLDEIYKDSNILKNYNYLLVLYFSSPPVNILNKLSAPYTFQVPLPILSDQTVTPKAS